MKTPSTSTVVLALLFFQNTAVDGFTTKSIVRFNQNPAFISHDAKSVYRRRAAESSDTSSSSMSSMTLEKPTTILQQQHQQNRFDSSTTEALVEVVESTSTSSTQENVSTSVKKPFLQKIQNVFRKLPFGHKDEANTLQTTLSVSEKLTDDNLMSTTAPTNGTEVVEQDETKRLLQQVKDAGIAGVISYAAWEIGFWAVSIPVVLAGYYEFTGHWPDLSNSDDIAKLSAEAFAFVNFARFAVPLRIGLALSTTPWIQANIVDRFMKEKKEG